MTTYQKEEVMFAGMILGVCLAFASLVYYIEAIYRPSFCAKVVMRGTARRLDWSGGWNNGTLIETENGACIVTNKDGLPAIGARGYVCENHHWHSESK